MIFEWCLKGKWGVQTVTEPPHEAWGPGGQTGGGGASLLFMEEMDVRSSACLPLRRCCCTDSPPLNTWVHACQGFFLGCFSPNSSASHSTSVSNLFLSLPAPPHSVFFIGGSMEFPNLSFSLELADSTSPQFGLQVQALKHYVSGTLSLSVIIHPSSWLKLTMLL